MYLHLGALVQVELVANGGLVLGREARPRLVGASVVVLDLGDLDVVVKAYDALVAQLLYGRPVAELAHEHLARLLLLHVDLLLRLGM